MKKLRNCAALVVSLWMVMAAAKGQAQAPAWQSVDVLNATMLGAISITANAADGAGNIYLTGLYSGSVTLGATTLTSVGAADVFVAKWNIAGRRFAWALSAGGSQQDIPMGMATGSNGVVYISGYFQSPTFSLGNTTLTCISGNTDNSNLFVAKLTDAGSSASFTWAQQGSGSASVYGFAMAVSGTNVYIGGGFMSASATFGSITVANTFITPTRQGDQPFIAKLTDTGTTGSFAWVQPLGGDGFEAIWGMTASGANVYATGTFYGNNIRFGTTTLTNTAPTRGDAFVAKLVDAGATGSFAWAQSGGGAFNEDARHIAVNGSNIYIAGSFASPTARFGSTVLTNANPLGSEDIFVAKLTDGPTGGFSWAQQAGGLNMDYSWALAVAGPDVYLAGSFISPSIAFGSNTLVNPVSSFNNNVFVTKLTDGGSTSRFAWAAQAGGAGNDVARTMTVTGGIAYVMGEALAPAAFGSLTLAGSSAAVVPFVASLQEGTLATASLHTLAGIALSPNPAHTLVDVQVPALAEGCTLTLLDALGRPARAITTPLPASGLHYPLDLAGLPAGVYALRVQAGAAVAVRRLVVE